MPTELTTRTLWDWPNQQVVRADCSGPGEGMAPGGYDAIKDMYASYAALHAAIADYDDLLYV